MRAGYYAILATSLLVSACQNDKGHGGTSAASADPSSQFPNDMPKQIPFYPGARLVSSKMTTGTSGKPAQTVVITTKDPEAKVRAFYSPKELPNLPSKGGDGTPGSTYWYQDLDKKLDVHVGVSAGGDGTNVTFVSNVM